MFVVNLVTSLLQNIKWVISIAPWCSDEEIVFE